jgi:UDP-glucose 4-epimerase
MKVLITGVAGFIGSNLAMRLVSENIEVTGIDNFSYGCERNISGLRKAKNFTFIHGDIADERTYGESRFDVVVHLASQKIPRYTNAFKTLDDNVSNLKKLTTKCIADKSKLIFASTSDIYGKNPNVPFSEESDIVLGPTTVKRWAYAITKIYGEQYIMSCHEEFGLDYTIARFFGVYGPNQNLTWWGGPQSVFISKALLKEEMEIHGDGRQQRTFTYIDDIIKPVATFVTDKKSDNQIFNVGSTASCEINVKDLAEMIWYKVNGDQHKAPLKFIPYSDFGKYEDVMRRTPDVSKLKEFFNIEPEWSLSDGLDETIAWQRNIK